MIEIHPGPFLSSSQIPLAAFTGRPQHFLLGFVLLSAAPCSKDPLGLLHPNVRPLNRQQQGSSLSLILAMPVYAKRQRETPRSAGRSYLHIRSSYSYQAKFATKIRVFLPCQCFGMVVEYEFPAFEFNADIHFMLPTSWLYMCKMLSVPVLMSCEDASPRMTREEPLRSQYSLYPLLLLSNGIGRIDRFSCYPIYSRSIKQPHVIDRYYIEDLLLPRAQRQCLQINRISDIIIHQGGYHLPLVVRQRQLANALPPQLSTVTMSLSRVLSDWQNV